MSFFTKCRSENNPDLESDGNLKQKEDKFPWKVKKRTTLFLLFD